MIKNISHKNPYKYIPFLAILFLSILELSFAQNTSPTNLNFEFPIIRSDSMATAWTKSNISIKNGLEAKVSPFARSGNYSLMINSIAMNKTNETNAAMVYQSIISNAYNGKKIKFSAYCKSENKAILPPDLIWIKIYNSDRLFTSYYSLGSKNKDSDNWERFEILCDIPQNAVKIDFGFMLQEKMKIYIDDVDFSLAGSAEYSSINLDKNQIKELIAFSKFLSPFLFYYPDAKLTKEDLRNIVEYGVDKILSTNGKIEDKLKDIFKFTGNNLIFTNSYKKSNLLKNIDTNKINNDKAFPGFRLYKGMYNISPNSIFESKIQNWNKNFRGHPNLLVQNILVSDYQNKKYKFKVFTKNKLINSYSKSFSLLVFNDADRKIISVTIPEPQNIQNKGDWLELSISGTIPENCNTLDVNLFLDGEGVALFDDASLIVEGNELINNGGFEDFSKHWYLDDKSELLSYKIAKNLKDIHSGLASIELKVANDENIIYPSLNDYYSYKINEDIYAQFPKIALINLDSSEDFIKYDDKTYQLFNNYSARIASVIYSYIFLDNFCLTNDYKFQTNKQNNIFADLEFALKSASIAKNERDLTRGIEKLAANFPDNAIRVWGKSDLQSQLKSLPIAFQYINDKLYIKNSNISNLAVGSKVIKINSIPTEDYFKNERLFISSSSEEYKNTKISSALRYSYIDKIDTFLIEIAGKQKEIILKFSPAEDNIFNDFLPPDTIFDKDIYYINFSIHNEKSISKLFRDHSSQMKGIIFDMRGYTGISEYFFKFFKSGNFYNLTWKSPFYTDYNKKPTAFTNIVQKVVSNSSIKNTLIIVLCDERSIGLAESHLFLLKQNNLAKFIGKESAGASTEPTVIPLPCELSMSISGFYASDINGNKLIANSFRPDIIVKTTLNDLKNGTDPIVLKAIETMKQLIQK